MHFTTDARVGKQFLDIEQSAGLAIDGVVRTTIAEHRARNSDFGVLNGKRPIGVINGQHDFGTAKRCALSGSSEDDVVHLAATQRLGALLAHHPGEGIHHIGFTRAVGAHHARNARFEAQRRRRCEGFESSHCQTFQMHALNSVKAPAGTR
ncbi:unannotated protein [freshwater metagenome]|uniref:Unannotated protein n=1 Tax=freshwater metagenome TaxID=449393 RepID=A0A6J6BRG0_9ZZZZ